jgi:hypothetical protein
MRQVAAVLGFVVVSLPLLVTPSWVVVAASGAAALLIAIGIAALSLRSVVAGIWVSLVEYTLALWVGARPLHPLTAVALGVALVLLLQVVDFARRFHPATTDAAVVTGQVRYWLRTGVLGGTAGFLASALAGGSPLPLPDAAQLGLAAAGALLAFIAVARLVTRSDPPWPSQRGSRREGERAFTDG